MTLFTIDTESVEDCKKHINILKSYLGGLSASKLGSKSERNKLLYSSCFSIYDTDISKLYDGILLDRKEQYYVYAHSYPDKNIAIGNNGISSFGAAIGMSKLPFYIGKWTGNRANQLNRNETHRKIRQKLHSFNKEVYVDIIQDSLTELEAFMLEAKLIDIFGLIANGGRLVNLDEGVSSSERKQLYIKELSIINSLYKNPTQR